ncbi:MAG: hypothetical protein IBX41_06655 [Methanophagales archaeon]|nr:hypothetical protein [Methanophagales archaeon]
MKEVYISLNFHAHEPLWDMPERLYKATSDAELAEMLTPPNYLSARMESGDDLYSFAIRVSRELDIPFGLEISNELIYQLQAYEATLETIKKGFEEKFLHPLLGHAHHTHIQFLTEEELIQEIEWNREALHTVFGVELTSPVGYFPTECSLEARAIPALKASGVDYVIFPHIENQEHLIRVVEGGSISDVLFKPFSLYSPDKSDRIIAVPRSYTVSQQIWRPLTKYLPAKANWQGYCLGLFPVLDEEFITGKTVRYPITFAEAVEEYLSFVKDALSRCPDNGLLLFVQDLELMGVGREMFEVLRATFKKLKENREKEPNVIFTTLRDYVEMFSETESSLPEVEFDKICWAPEIHGELRVDGLYLPLGVKRYRDISGSEIYTNDPFIFWTPGRHLIDLFAHLIHTWLRLVKPFQFTWATLSDSGYDLSELDTRIKIKILHLLQKRACNWGWRPEEDRQKWSFLYGYLISKELLRVDAMEIKSYEERELKSLVMYPLIFLDMRLRYLKRGLHELGTEHEVHDAWKNFHIAEKLSAKVKEDIEDLVHANRRLIEGEKGPEKDMIQKIEVFCKDFCLATDSIQKVWAASHNPEFLVTEMYKSLHDIYPPKYPELKEEYEREDKE